MTKSKVLNMSLDELKTEFKKIKNNNKYYRGSGCSWCTGCSGCAWCFDCSDCARCFRCSCCYRCYRCSGCSGCSNCLFSNDVKNSKFYVLNTQLTGGEYKELTKKLGIQSN